jgi:hypothetical protein
MAITTGTANWYYSALHYAMRKVIDFDNDSFRMGLSTQTYTPNQANHELLSHITNELSGNGYARQLLANVTLLPNAAPFTALQTVNCDDPVFTANGGSLVARWWWIFDDTPTSPLDPLIMYGLLDETPANVTTLDGNVLTFTVNAAGLAELETP